MCKSVDIFVSLCGLSQKTIYFDAWKSTDATARTPMPVKTNLMYIQTTKIQPRGKQRKKEKKIIKK